MKILAVMGSPRKGNTYKAVQMLEEHMKKLGDVDFQYVFLKDMNLGNCTGCHLCINKGEDHCPLKDDRARLEQLMQEADGLILASPVYAMSVTAYMKNYFDHFSYLWHRPRFFNKKAMSVATGGGQFKDILKYMKTNAVSWGYDHVAELGIPHFDALTEKYRQKALADIAAKAERFYTALTEQKKEAPSFGKIMWFRMWRINANACKDSNPCDYAYWTEKGWLRSDFYYDVKIGFLKRVFVPYAERAALGFMRKIYKGY